MQLVILGAPGAGKGTFAQNINSYKELLHISTGDLFRKHIKEGTDLGKLAASYINEGDLVPDDVTDQLIYHELEQVKKDFLLDGYPRNLHQAEKLKEILNELNIPLTACLHLTIDKDIVLARLTNRIVCSSCGYTYNLKIAPPKVEGICDQCGGDLIQRKDDNKETILHRFETYEKETLPLVEFYAKDGKLIDIDCSEKGVLDQLDDIWQILSRMNK